MADYSTQKVPDLKKLLSERGLVISGNKADLIARLQEDDAKKSGGAVTCTSIPLKLRNSDYAPSHPFSQTRHTDVLCHIAGAGEDEIDWDEDDNKPAEATTAPAAAAIAAGGVGQVNTPVAVPNQKAAIDPSTTSDLTVKQPEATPSTTEAAPAAEEEKKEEPKPEEPRKDYTLGLVMSEAEKEAEKRAARAKRFGKKEPAADGEAPAKEQTEEEKKLEERAKKFGTAKPKEQEVVGVEGLNSALPERRLKRERDGRDSRDGGRQAKRQTPDRRMEGQRRGGGGGGQQGQRGGRGGERRAGGGGGAAAGQGLKKVTDDPSEKAKAEARARRFAPKENGGS